MRHLLRIHLLAVVALSQLGATTQPRADPAKRMADELRDDLKDARVASIQFRVNREAEPRLRLNKADEITPVVKCFLQALAADDLHEGTQRHQPTRVIHIRFEIRDGPDVRLNDVGQDMFWATKSDEAEPKPKWTNLQTPALTKCFQKQIDKISATSRPSSPGK